MTDEATLQIELELVLPDLDQADPCRERLRAMLEGRRGVRRVHFESGGTKLCVHFSPDTLSIAQVTELARIAGLELLDRYRHIHIAVRGINNERRARTVARRLESLPGVIHARASASSARLHLELEPGASLDLVRSTLRRLGVTEAKEKPEHGHGHGHGGHHHGAGVTELAFAVTSGLLTAVGWSLQTWSPSTPAWVPLALFSGAYFFGGAFAVREAFQSIRNKRFEVDFLMLLAAAGAAALGEWAEGGLLLFLFSVGHALEGYAMGRARRAIEALAELAPPTAEVLVAGEVVERPVAELAVGDRVLVRPNSRFPADGFVVKGTSAVNQAAITGESMPVDKEPVADPDAAAKNPERVSTDSRVFAGSINGSTALELIVTRHASESTLARVVEMVRAAQTQQSPTQRFTDRFERIFVPTVLALVVVTLFAWVVIDEPFAASFYRSMAVLVAASPCALAIATPSAVLSGIARAARGGVLIKGGAHLESLGAADLVAFDKTGTLTRGEPQLVSVHAAPDILRSELARIAVAIENQSDHPLADAIVRGLESDVTDVPAVSNVEAITGYGVRASVEGRDYFLGKPDLFTELLSIPLADAVKHDLTAIVDRGETAVVVGSENNLLGVLGLLDTPRPAAKTTIATLRELGVRRMVMLSGDHQRAAEAIAREVGVDEAHGDLLPAKKVDFIRELSTAGTVAMVGDGVNDAPALAQATVGIAMGASGSDVALEVADVALMADDISKLPFAIGLSRAARRIIRQNLWASLGMVAFLIPATLFGFAGIGWAVVLHEGSTLVVVANALRLLAYRTPSLMSE